MSKHILGAVLAVASLGVLSLAQEAPQKSSAKVLIAGTGTEPYINTVTDEIADQLSVAGVTLEPLTGGGKSRTAATERLKSSDAHSLVYVTLDIGAGQKDKLKVQCFDKEGKQLWEEQSSGGFAMNAGGSVKNMLKGMKKKLEPHIGQPGLPKG